MRAMPSLLATPLTTRKPALLVSLMYAATVKLRRSRLVVNVVPSARTWVMTAHAITVLAGATGQSGLPPSGSGGGASTYVMSPRPMILEQPPATAVTDRAQLTRRPRTTRPGRDCMTRASSYTCATRPQARTGSAIDAEDSAGPRMAQRDTRIRHSRFIDAGT